MIFHEEMIFQELSLVLVISHGRQLIDRTWGRVKKPRHEKRNNMEAVGSPLSQEKETNVTVQSIAKFRKCAAYLVRGSVKYIGLSTKSKMFFFDNIPY